MAVGSGDTPAAEAAIRLRLADTLHHRRDGIPRLCQKLNAVLDENPEALDESREVPASELLIYLVVLAREVEDDVVVESLLNVTSKVLGVMLSSSAQLFRAGYLDAARLVVRMADTRGKLLVPGSCPGQRVEIFQSLKRERGRQWDEEPSPTRVEAGNLGPPAVDVRSAEECFRMARVAAHLCSVALNSCGVIMAYHTPPALFEALRRMLLWAQTIPSQTDFLRSLGEALEYCVQDLTPKCVGDLVTTIATILSAQVGNSAAVRKPAFAEWEVAVVRTLEKLVDTLATDKTLGTVGFHLGETLLREMRRTDQWNHFHAHLCRMLTVLADAFPLLAANFGAVLPLLVVDSQQTEPALSCVERLIDLLTEGVLEMPHTGTADEEIEDPNVSEEGGDGKGRYKCTSLQDVENPIPQYPERIQIATGNVRASFSQAMLKHLQRNIISGVASIQPTSSGSAEKKLCVLQMLLTASSRRPHIDLFLHLSKTCSAWFNWLAQSENHGSLLENCTRILNIAELLLEPLVQMLHYDSEHLTGLHQLSTSPVIHSLAELLKTVWVSLSNEGRKQDRADDLIVLVLRVGMLLELLLWQAIGSQYTPVATAMLQDSLDSSTPEVTAAALLVMPILLGLESRFSCRHRSEERSHSQRDTPTLETCLQLLESNLSRRDEPVMWSIAVSLGSLIVAFSADFPSQWVDTVLNILQLSGELCRCQKAVLTRSKNTMAGHSQSDREYVVNFEMDLGQWEPLCRVLLANGSTSKVKVRGTWFLCSF